MVLVPIVPDPPCLSDEQMAEIKDRVNLCLAAYAHKNPFIGSLLMLLRVRLKNGYHAAGSTNGHTLTLDVGGKPWRKPFQDMKVGGQQALILHELLHVLLNHPFEMAKGDWDPKIANLAMDAVINRLVSKHHGRYALDELGEYGVRVKDTLLTIKLVNPLTGECAFDRSWEIEDLPVMDWKEVYDILIMDKELAGHEGECWDVEPPETWEEAEDLRRKVENHCRRNASLARGSEGLLNDLGLSFEAKPAKVPWGTMLAAHVQSCMAGGSDYSHKFKSRSMHLGLFRSMNSPQTEVVFALDTSGSMSAEELVAGLNEVRSILSSFNALVHFVCCDAAADEVLTLQSTNQPNWEQFPVVGGGGTDFSPVFELVERERAAGRMTPQAIVYFTDGGGSFPANPPQGVPVIWVNTSKHTRQDHYPWGVVIDVF